MFTFEFLNVEEAKRKLSNTKAESKNIVCIINFDKDTAERKLITFTESCQLIEKANTIIHNEDEYIPHLELYSITQKDIANIIPKGIMHDIYIAKK